MYFSLFMANDKTKQAGMLNKQMFSRIQQLILILSLNILLNKCTVL